MVSTRPPRRGRHTRWMGRLGNWARAPVVPSSKETIAQNTSCTSRGIQFLPTGGRIRCYAFAFALLQSVLLTSDEIRLVQRVPHEAEHRPHRSSRPSTWTAPSPSRFCRLVGGLHLSSPSHVLWTWRKHVESGGRSATDECPLADHSERARLLGLCTVAFFVLEVGEWAVDGVDAAARAAAVTRKRA